MDKIIRLWDTRTGALLQRFEGHRDSVYSVAFSPNGKSFVSGSLDRSLKIWDISPKVLDYLEHADPMTHSLPTVKDSKPRHTFVGHRDFVLAVAFPGKFFDRTGDREEGDDLDDIDFVVSGSKDRTVTFWDGRGVGDSMASQSALHNVPLFMLQGHKNSGSEVFISFFLFDWRGEGGISGNNNSVFF